MRTPMNMARYALGFRDGGCDAGMQLSCDYEQAAGVRGVAASYQFPNQLTATRYDHWANSFCGFRNGDGAQETHFLQDTWDDLIALNPQLRRVNTYGHPTTLRYGIFGAASLFNPDDIEFYIEIERRCDSAPMALLVHSLPSYKALHNEIFIRTGVETSWVAAPKTLLTVRDQVIDLPAQYDVRDVFAHVSVDKLISPAQFAKAKTYVDPLTARKPLMP